VLQALRLATRSRHAKLESCRAMARLFDPTYSVSEYRAHLGRLLGLFEPLERSVARAAGPSDLASSLQRARDLREDLFTMGATTKEVDALERCRCLPPIPAQGLLGYSYVILGSSLGAKIIVKQLRTVLGPRAPACSSTVTRKAAMAALWPIFLQSLEENGRNDIRTICADSSRNIRCLRDVVMPVTPGPVTAPREMHPLADHETMCPGAGPTHRVHPVLRFALRHSLNPICVQQVSTNVSALLGISPEEILGHSIPRRPGRAAI
jgi:heme oxygenase